MKALIGIVTLLALAIVGVSVWGFLTAGELGNVRAELATVKSELASTTTELEETKVSLAAVTDELTDNKKDLADTEAELTDTRDNLENTKDDLSIAESKLSSTKRELTRVEEDLSGTQEQLDIAEETLNGLGITLRSSKQCHDVELIDNPLATNPTWAQLKAFLEKDTTDTHEYIAGVYDCSQFSRDVHNNAEAAGIRAAEVQVWFENEYTGHALNAFLTTDYGLVYVDSTGSPDIIPRVVAGKGFRGTYLEYITATNVRNDAWWDSLDYYYYISNRYGDEVKTSRIIIYW